MKAGVYTKVTRMNVEMKTFSDHSNWVYNLKMKMFHIYGADNPFINTKLWAIMSKIIQVVLYFDDANVRTRITS